MSNPGVTVSIQKNSLLVSGILALLVACGGGATVSADEEATARKAAGPACETPFSYLPTMPYIVDSEHPWVEVAGLTPGTFTTYSATITNGSTTTESSGSVPPDGAPRIDLAPSIDQATRFQRQTLTVKVALEGDDAAEKVACEVTYAYLASSPVPWVSVEAHPVPDSRDRVDATFRFCETPGEDGLYTPFGDCTDAAGTIWARGQSSLTFPKKSFAMNLGKDNAISLMGMPASHKWVMIGGYVDATHLANKVSYDLYAEMGHYGPQSQHVQVDFNGEYWGLYTFGEKVQRGKEHVDTKKKSEGGFIVKLVDTPPDFTSVSGRTFDWEYPDEEEITAEQKAAIEGTINGFEQTVMDGGDWRALLNEEAEIDYFLVTDAFANGDSYYNDKNLFWFKNQENELEPVIWDFIWAYHPPYFPQDPWWYIYSPPNELMYGNTRYGNRSGYNRFALMKWYMKDAQNVDMYKGRYKMWREGLDGHDPILSDKSLAERMDGLIEVLDSGDVYAHDAARWDLSPAKYYTAVQFRDKLLARMANMDEKVPLVRVEE